MHIKLNGILKGEYGNMYRAIEYYSADSDFRFIGHGWINTETETREINPNKGFCIWELVDDSGFNYEASNGESIREVLKMAIDDFNEEKRKTHLFSGTSYKNIILPIANESFADYLIISKRNQQAFQCRINRLLPILKETNRQFVELDAILKNSACGYDPISAIALVEGKIGGNYSNLWFNLDTGTADAGDRPLTVIMKKNYDSKVQDDLKKYEIRGYAEIESRVWNDHTMREYIDEYNETIGFQISKLINCTMSPTLVNHHLIITKNQIPENWYYNNGSWYKKTNDNNSEGVGLLGLLLSCL